MTNLRYRGRVQNTAQAETVPLAIVSTPDDWEPYPEIVLDPTTKEILARTSKSTLDPLYELFGTYEVPIGLISKVALLETYHLHFLLDDSGSMNYLTDLTGAAYKSTYMKSRLSTQFRLKRWDELHDRVHLMLQFLVHVPCQSLVLTFLNRSSKLTVNPAEMTIDGVHAAVAELFTPEPTGGTPLYGKLKALLNSPESTMIYLFTDGCPSDSTIGDMVSLIERRVRPKSYPVSLFSCTDQDNEVAWMKLVDESALYVCEVDDYVTERKEVIDKQGVVFPYTIGMWILCHLVSAICPDDLDALDESNPLTPTALSRLFGRVVDEEDYRRYIREHEKANRHSRQNVCDECVIS